MGVEDDEVIGEFERDGGALRRLDGEGGADGVRFDTGEVYLLEEGAAVTAGAEAVRGELGGDELGGELATALAGVAAFQQVVREVLIIGRGWRRRRRWTRLL